MTQLAKTDKDYASWIEELSQRYRKSQIKAEIHVNRKITMSISPIHPQVGGEFPV